jgi:hypothetical protein
MAQPIQQHRDHLETGFDAVLLQAVQKFDRLKVGHGHAVEVA